MRSLFSSTRREVGYSYERPPHRGVAITLCILISGLLWFTFTMQETYTVVLQLPTVVDNLPADQALVAQPPANVRVSVQGEGWTLLQLYANRPAIRINAANEQVNLEDAVASTDLPKNVRLAGVSPSTLNLRKERRVERRVPIRLRARVDPADTYDYVRAPRIRPDSVRIAGAVSIVSRITDWPTEPRTFTDVKDTLRATVALADTLRGLVQRSVDEVALFAVTQQFTEDDREITIIVTDEPSNQTLVTLVPPTIRVVYKVLFSQYEEARDAPDFFATVSYDAIRSDTTGRVYPVLHLPEDLVLRDVKMIPPSLRYYQRLE